MPRYEGPLPELKRSVRVPVARFGKFQKRWGAETVRSMFSRALPAASKEVQKLLEHETIKRGIYFKRRFARGWRVRLGRQTGLSATVYNKQYYAIVIEKGRRAGRRAPPTSALIEWVQVKLGVSAREAPRVAFLVARAIGIKGIGARPILGNPVIQLRIRKTLTGATYFFMQQGMIKGMK